ncbi:MAG: prepilin-type N-terminal cleavage/methylation domain-containing protein [bacterium]
MKNGYTMIELLIIIVISGLLMTLGASAYRKTQDRQSLRADVETFTSLLESAKKQATIGDKDCTGPLVGIQITLTSGSKTITQQAICQNNNGAIVNTVLTVSTPDISSTFSFRPLNGSTTLNVAGLNIIFSVSASLTNAISISQAGAITHAAL